MTKKQIIINGSNFSDMNGFYTEVDSVLTKDLTWETGHNLNAFNDLLRGGVGVHEYGEPITIIWKYANKSKKDLGYKATVRYYGKMLTRCNPSNTKEVSNILQSAKYEKGDTLFDILIQIIKEHDYIELILR